MTIDTFTAAEAASIAPYFTNLDRSVFALVNLPETVKGALFARYSRSPKSLRRLFLDEFFDRSGTDLPAAPSSAGVARADRLYEKVFNEYGDTRQVGLGVLDPHRDEVETPERVKERILRATKILGDPRRIWVNPDCGLRTRRLDIAFAKLKNMDQGAALARAEIAGRGG